jgi:hypothetical protein
VSIVDKDGGDKSLACEGHQLEDDLLRGIVIDLYNVIDDL